MGMPLNLSKKQVSDSGNNSPAIGGNNTSTGHDFDPVAWAKSRSPSRRIPMPGWERAKRAQITWLDTSAMSAAKRPMTRTAQPKIIHRLRETASSPEEDHQHREAEARRDINGRFGRVEEKLPHHEHSQRKIR